MRSYGGSLWRRMHRTTIMIPDDLKEQAAKRARERGVSFGELVREALRDCLQRAAAKKSGFADDPVFADTAVFEGDSPIDAAPGHDDHLYGTERD